MKIFRISRLVLPFWFAAVLHLRADCTLTNLGLTALNDLGPRVYKGYSGGLYPNGLNTRPMAHEAAGLSIATNVIQPLNVSGGSDHTNGKIVLLSIGMSNTTDEWSSLGTSNFLHLATLDPAKNPRVVIVDGAQGGQDATKWTNGSDATWSTVLQRLTTAGVSTNQVQAIWLKQALAGPANYGEFPLHAQALEIALARILRVAKSKYPNLQLAYLSCRTRCYTAVTNALNPEPFAFETGFADKWVIQDQIEGKSELNFDPVEGAVFAPWLSWGPYLWTDGMAGRSDGLRSICPDDLQADFTHPSANGGVPKVARQLLAFFKTDPTTAPWFLKRTANPPDLTVSASATNGVAPLSVTFTATATSSAGPVNTFAWTYDDGDFADVQNPTKIFTAAGIYHVHVTAEDAAGNAATATATIEVTVQPGSLQFTAVQASGADLKMEWATRSGESYVVQAATNLVINLSNNFSDISSLIQAPPIQSGTTGYTDAGVLTNSAGRFYRLRLGP